MDDGTPPKGLVGLPPRLARVSTGGALALCLWGSSALAACPDAANSMEARTILSLYDGRMEPEPRDTRVHRFLALPLNHLGYTVSYHDISNGMPRDLMDNVAAVLSWMDGIPEESGYIEWIDRNIAECGGARKRIIIGSPIGEMGNVANDMALAGLQWTGSDIHLGDMSEVVLQDDHLGFESDYMVMRGRYGLARAREGASPLLRVRPHGGAEGDGTDLAVIGPSGGYLHESAAILHDPVGDVPLWVVDPFWFLEEVLDAGARPIPDTTTANGNRVYFSTVNSEGWLSEEAGRTIGQKPPLGAELLRDELILPALDLPVSISVLTGDLDPALGGRDATTGLEVARSLLSLPNVQPATTGANLVVDWAFFDDYDPGREVERLASGLALQDSPQRGLLGDAVHSLGTAFGQARQSSFDVAPDAPRKYTVSPFSLESEIDAPLEWLSELAPEATPLYLWPGGGARPFEGALERVAAQGALSLGGGGGQYAGVEAVLANLSLLQALSARGGRSTAPSRETMPTPTTGASRSTASISWNRRWPEPRSRAGSSHSIWPMPPDPRWTSARAAPFSAFRKWPGMKRSFR